MGKVPTQTLQLECSLVTKYFSEMHLEPCQVSVKLLFAKTVTLECPLIEGGRRGCSSTGGGFGGWRGWGARKYFKTLPNKHSTYITEYKD